MSHAFCLVPGIWGCLRKVVVNTGHNSSFHEALYFRENEHLITYKRHVTSSHIVTWRYFLYRLTGDYLKAFQNSVS